ncbi:hypothetical protein BJ684DRAFT_5428, partial [Piptocephalis cylindrospora]
MTTPMSKAEEEAMSAALIAQLLQEDEEVDGGSGGYYAEYDHSVRKGTGRKGRSRPDSDEDGGEWRGDESEEDDYTPNKRSKAPARRGGASVKRGRGARRGRPSTQSTPPSTAEQDEVQPNQTHQGIMNTGIYTDEEEENEHLGTRNTHSISSHAQKYFIKAYRDGLTLPLKIRQSGEGYTLSGAPLEKESSAARPYLQGKTIPELSYKANLRPQFHPRPPEDDVGVDREENEIISDDAHSRKKEPKVHTHDQQEEAQEEGATDLVDGKTEYSRSRPQRSAAARSAPHRHHPMQNEDPLSMVKCEEYTDGAPGSGLPGSQPFAIRVTPKCLVAMDLHSHLRHTEVIGFLGGLWNDETKTLHIMAAYPCSSMAVDEGHVSVEMDPESAIRVRSAISQHGLEVIGWYHSHPLFAPDPSLVDLENQKNYQRFFREESTKEERFVGAIAGTWDQRLPGSVSVHNWFHVQGSGDTGSSTAKRLRYEVLPELELAQKEEGLTEEEMSQMVALVQEYGYDLDRVDPQQRWRKDREETRLDKITRSMAHWSP